MTDFKPGPLSNAFPHLVDTASGDRPFLTDWLSVAIVIEIQTDSITVQIPAKNDAAYHGLKQPNVSRYLSELACQELGIVSADEHNAFRVTLAAQESPAATPATKPQTPRASKAPVNKLTLHEVFKLGDWIRQNAERVKVEPDTRLAAIAQAELDFSISVSNFTSAREAIGIEKVKPATPPTLEERVSILEQIVAKLAAGTETQAEATTAELSPA